MSILEEVGASGLQLELGSNKLKHIFSAPSLNNKKLILLSVLTLLLFVRAYPRLLGPEVWDEDGTRNLFGFLNVGFSDIFTPVNGYLIIVPKLITHLSASISIVQYPLISTIFAWVSILVVLVIIAIAPIQLSGGWMLAILCLWIPSDPEVFGLPLYTFWWTSLLLYISVFWDQSRNLILRMCLIILASLSSPVCLVVLPLFWIKGYLGRSNCSEILLALIATGCAAIQLLNMHLQNSENAVAPGLNVVNLLAFGQVVPKFIGAYVLGNLNLGGEVPIGIAVIILLGFSLIRNRSPWVMWGLAYLWFVAVLMSVSRVDLKMIHQATSGPRYFFYPFILLSWWLLQIALTTTHRWMQGYAWAILILAAINVWPVLNRKHDELNWKGHVHSCQFFQNYILPVQVDGRSAFAWGVSVSRNQCKKFLSKEPFVYKTTSLTYPFSRVIEKSSPSMNESSITISSIVVDKWLGSDYYHSYFEGMSVLGSYVISDADLGSLTLHMKRGDKIWYRTGPSKKGQRIQINGASQFFDDAPSASDWTLIEFSNELLPDEFEVNFIDEGTGWGEWSAVALKITNKK